MSFRNHIRILKPREETHVAPVEKVQHILYEAQLKKVDIFKRDNQNKFVSLAIKGELVDKNGKKLPKVKSDDPLLVSIKNAKTKEEIPNKNFDTTPSFNIWSSPFVTFFANISILGIPEFGPLPAGFCSSLLLNLDSDKTFCTISKGAV